MVDESDGKKKIEIDADAYEYFCQYIDEDIVKRFVPRAVQIQDLSIYTVQFIIDLQDLKFRRRGV